MHLNELSSPVPVVDYDIASRNIGRLQQYCDTHQFGLRPYIGREKAERLANLANFAGPNVAIDNVRALKSLGWAARRASTPIGVLIEFESGGNRQGVQTPEQAALYHPRWTCGTGSRES